MSSVPQLKKDFIQTLHSFSHSHNQSTVFSDWLEMAAISLHQLPYHNGDFPKDETFADLEAKYTEREKCYTPEERTAFAKLFGLSLMAHREGFSDFLGEIAAEQELLNERGGQFFTPYEVCKMMAKMTFADAKAIVEEKGLITVSEPASGGGAMVIASAEALVEQGVDPRSCAQFDCIDISRDAFNMTYIQLAALDLQAVVRHGNTLSNEMWESRPTPQLRYFDQWIREHQQIARLEQLRDFFVNPEAFPAASSQEGEEEVITTDSLETSAPQAQEVAEQPSLFEIDTFAPADPTERRPSRRKADVTLPQPEQLDLFGQERQGE
ncbi:MAG: SAM-dependent DNA methyltransferase [Leptolyngbya sp. SIOISBB]|nr:SAM-dependent DNA methyltransferase [Leptolyngbya sp. SIOISBB]